MTGAVGHRQISTALFTVGLMAMLGFLVIGLAQKPKPFRPLKGTNHGAPIRGIEAISNRIAATRQFELLTTAQWPVPTAQAEDGKWLYDVFTPPRIYVNPETGDFESTAYQFERQELVPTLSLESIHRPLFRYQLSGYIENSLTDASSSILLVEDLETGETQRIYFEPGATIGEGYRMESFVITKTLTDAGAILRSGALVVSSDQGTSLTLNSSGQTYCSGSVMKMRLGDLQFIIDDQHPSYLSEKYQVIWNINNAQFPTLEFQITDLETSKSSTYLLKSNQVQDL